MKRFTIFAAAAALLAVLGSIEVATAGQGGLKSRVAARQSQMYPWHGDYYDATWGMPVAVVVPPTAEAQTHLGWGVGATRITPIQHQYGRPYSGPGVYNRAWFRPTPAQPSSTDQFGDYYIRGPW